MESAFPILAYLRILCDGNIQFKYLFITCFFTEAQGPRIESGSEMRIWSNLSVKASRKPEDGFQLFQFQGWRDAEHALFAIEAAIYHEDVAVRIESEEIAEGLDGDDGAREQIYP